MAEKSKLENLKKEYVKFESKYKLPSFQKLNEDFDIEKTAEHESEMVLRDIRKAIMDKSLAYLRFLELFLNPTNAPFFFFAILKNLGADDKKKIEGIYKELGEFEIDAIELDNEYAEKKEADFIKKGFKKWQEIKGEMKIIVESLRRSWKANSDKKEKAYFG